MFNWQLASKLFDGFNILRWTDFLRPTEYVEIEKHAVQSILTYIIGKEYEEITDKKLNWEFIVNENIFGLLSKIATSDIKSTVHAKLKKDVPDKLNECIINTYFNESTKQPRYFKDGIITEDEFRKYLNKEISKELIVEANIVYFAHKYATYREFLSIEIFNSLSPDLTRVKNEIEETLSKVSEKSDNDLKNIFTSLKNREGNLYNFYTYFEKLRPQTRWSQTCRLPKTTVLGHSMYVAILIYFALKELDTSLQNNILVNGFFAALFHDLPESLTRDIISPVKRNIEKLDKNIISAVEFKEVNETMIIKIRDKKWVNHFMSLLGETSEKVLSEEGKEITLNIFEPFLERSVNGMKIPGQLISYIDKIAAFIEAKMSVDFGVNSTELQNGIKYTVESLLHVVYQNPFEMESKPLSMNDFFATIPQYTIGPN